MNTEKPKIVTLYDKPKEGLFLSWGRDAFSFGCLLFSTWFVNVVIPPSGWFNALVAFLWLCFMLSRSVEMRFKMTAVELREWLDENYPETK